MKKIVVIVTCITGLYQLNLQAADASTAPPIPPTMKRSLSWNRQPSQRPNFERRKSYEDRSSVDSNAAKATMQAEIATRQLIKVNVTGNVLVQEAEKPVHAATKIQRAFRRFQSNDRIMVQNRDLQLLAVNVKFEPSSDEPHDFREGRLITKVHPDSLYQRLNKILQENPQLKYQYIRVYNLTTKSNIEISVRLFAHLLKELAKPQMATKIQTLWRKKQASKQADTVRKYRQDQDTIIEELNTLKEKEFNLVENLFNDYIRQYLNTYAVYYIHNPGMLSPNKTYIMLPVGNNKNDASNAADKNSKKIIDLINYSAEKNPKNKISLALTHAPNANKLNEAVQKQRGGKIEMKNTSKILEVTWTMQKIKERTRVENAMYTKDIYAPNLNYKSA